MSYTSLEEIERDFDLLKEYMHIYIQLLPYITECGGKKLWKCQLPTFEYFKETYHDERYSLMIPHFKEAYWVNKDKEIFKSHIEGTGSHDGIAYRYFNYWRCGAKYFPRSDKFIFNEDNFKKAIK